MATPIKSTFYPEPLLRDRLESLARHERRSFSAQVVRICEEWLAAHGDGQPFITIYPYYQEEVNPDHERDS